MLGVVGLVVRGYGQVPVLTVENLPKPGYSVMYHIDDSARVLTLSIANDTNVVWDLRGMVTVRDSQWIRYVLPSQTPYVGMDPCVDTSDYAIEMEPALQAYLFMDQVRGAVNMDVSLCVGIWNFQTGNLMILPALDRDTLAIVPLTYGDVLADDGVYWTWMDTTIMGVPDTIDIYIRISHEDSIKAWGTLFLPDGTTFPVLNIQRKTTLHIQAIDRLLGQTFYELRDSTLDYNLLTDDTSYHSALATFQVNFSRDSVLRITWQSQFTPPLTGIEAVVGQEKAPALLWMCASGGCGMVFYRLPEVKSGSAYVAVVSVDGRVLWRRTLDGLRTNRFYRVPMSAFGKYLIVVDTGSERYTYSVYGRY